MFSTGDMVVYGISGIYRVEGIGCPDIKGCGDRQYYTMTPVFGTGTSYVPVDSKVFMRSIMTGSEAEEFISTIPDIEADSFNDRNPRAVKEHYSASLKSHDLRSMISMIKAIYSHEKAAKRTHRKISTAEQHFMQQAEDLIYSELAAALDIPRESVCDHIKQRLGNKE